jgi:phosphoglycolate phosphatase-like HAD superfamily hydrolase
LLTGNFERGACLKLEYFDLWRYFTCGAFGDTTHDRNALLPEALARVVVSGGPRAAPADVVIIGDTPLDVGVAIAGGARSMAVATGSHTTDELRASGADVVFQALSDLEAVWRPWRESRELIVVSPRSCRECLIVECCVSLRSGERRLHAAPSGNPRA